MLANSIISVYMSAADEEKRVVRSGWISAAETLLHMVGANGYASSDISVDAVWHLYLGIYADGVGPSMWVAQFWEGQPLRCLAIE